MLQPGVAHWYRFLGLALRVGGDVDGDFVAGELRWDPFSSGCLDWIARIRLSMSVLKMTGLLSSELSKALEYSAGEVYAVVS